MHLCTYLHAGACARAHAVQMCLHVCMREGLRQKKDDRTARSLLAAHVAKVGSTVKAAVDAWQQAALAADDPQATSVTAERRVKLGSALRAWANASIFGGDAALSRGDRFHVVAQLIEVFPVVHMRSHAPARGCVCSLSGVCAAQSGVYGALHAVCAFCAHTPVHLWP